MAAAHGEIGPVLGNAGERNIKMLEAEMSPADISKAQELAAEWWGKHN